MDELGAQMIPALLTAKRAWAQRVTSLTWQGRLPQELRLHQLRTLEAANRFLAGRLHRRVCPLPSGRAQAAGNAFGALRRSRDLDRIFLAVSSNAA